MIACSVTSFITFLPGLIYVIAWSANYKKQQEAGYGKIWPDGCQGIEIQPDKLLIGMGVA